LDKRSRSAAGPDIQASNRSRTGRREHGTRDRRMGWLRAPGLLHRGQSQGNWAPVCLTGKTPRGDHHIRLCAQHLPALVIKRRCPRRRTEGERRRQTGGWPAARYRGIVRQPSRGEGGRALLVAGRNMGAVRGITLDHLSGGRAPFAWCEAGHTAICPTECASNSTAIIEHPFSECCLGASRCFLCLMSPP
jgi:hypothetical protein